MCYELPECVGIASQILETSVQPLVDCTSNAHSLTLLLTEFSKNFLFNNLWIRRPIAFFFGKFFFFFRAGVLLQLIPFCVRFGG
ncbi:uncharacterized protein CGFF_00280 [Nakaseomyces glabratus]|nr:hypothetical protein J6894_03296 [Nakaseomyces glabratus]QNG15368.1 uncharacterized protein GWK60_J11165 [Nakaseomyces glabratus]SCV12723.1 uncharacterized protein CGFF_00280 [Nakaseomyces glabratus]SLM10401.1 uncharacterized protein CGFF_00280 [Nakaseomyces glabratus]